jgi:hypothetical protein
MKLLLYLFVAWLPIVALAAIVSLPYDARAQSVNLAWDPNPETNAVGYKVLWGPTSRHYNATNVVAGRLNNTAVVTNLLAGPNFFAVVAFDDTGLESDFSNEVTWTNRPSAPKNLKLSATLEAASSPTGPWRNLARVEVPLPAVVPAQPFYRAKLGLEEER